MFSTNTPLNCLYLNTISSTFLIDSLYFEANFEARHISAWVSQQLKLSPYNGRAVPPYCDFWLFFYNLAAWPNHMRPVESFLWLTAQEEVREIQCTRMIQQHRHLHCFENGGDHVARNTGCHLELRADSQQGIMGLCPRATRNWIPPRIRLFWE